MERFRPQDVEIQDDIREILFTSDSPPEDKPVIQRDAANDHAVNILLSIPRFDLERAHALQTVAYIIHFDDTANNTVVWGLVGIDATTVSIRWRQRSTLSLERATEELVASVSNHAGPDKLFHPFEAGHRIPVREPLSNINAYSGEILGTKDARVRLAREEKKSERRIAIGSIIIFLLCTVAGFLCFRFSNPDATLRWISGALDRLATTALATAGVSYLGYFFARRDLLLKPVIDWQ
jgi:hypothetical protein